MKKTASMIIKETIESRELALYQENTSELWPMIQAKINMLKKHVKRNQYNHEKAIEALYPVACEAAKMYAKEFADVNSYGHIFNVTARWTAAAVLLEYIESEYLFREA